jgi:DNA mismatch repair ATPase MutS
LDALLGIVGIADICFPVLGGTASPLRIEGVYHPMLESRIPNTVTWSPACKHAILTGPNRGGKSTLCRAVGISILCAQTWGFAFAGRMDLQPFEWIETALHPADTLGAMSLFEAEIEFAKTVLAKGGRGFVMMDEIFHSTNARDGLAASQVFLRQLYTKECVSLISTHYGELPAEFAGTGHALAWAMEAEEVEGRLKYTYKKVDGVSDKSSVMEILRERGLVS